jgi:hypothetical protein
LTMLSGCLSSRHVTAAAAALDAECPCSP